MPVMNVGGQTAISYYTMKKKLVMVLSRGNENIKDRDTVFEFYIIPPYRRVSSTAFSKLLSVSGVSFIECQSNDLLLTALLYEYGQHINSDVVLFEENTQSCLYVKNVLFRKRNNDDIIFDHKGRADW
jgi:hypothetical protein